jgi:hypothetical protein
VPDRFFRAELAQAAAGEAAPDGEGERDPFSGNDGWDADNRPDDRAGVRTGKQARKERSRKGQVGRVVIDEEARHDAGCERNAKAGGENQPLRPVALFRQEDAAEPGKPHQHRRQHRDDRHLDDERGQQELLGGEGLGGLGHRGDYSPSLFLSPLP